MQRPGVQSVFVPPVLNHFAVSDRPSPDSQHCPLACGAALVHAEVMSRTASTATLAKLLDQSTRPIYAIDAERRIVYCNSALASWLEIERGRILGRLVEYHSEPGDRSLPERTAESPLAELCPPPIALEGAPCLATISCVRRNGGLVHRRAECLPLDAPAGFPAAGPKARRPTGAVLVVLAADDLAHDELQAALSTDPPADELHRVIRQFRRTQAGTYDVESMIGDSAAMRKVRAQVAAAVSSGANVLIRGPRASGRGHVARAIHYQAHPDGTGRLVPVDCQLVDDERLRQAVDGITKSTEVSERPTLLLENLESLAPAHQASILSAIRNGMPVRVVSTSSAHDTGLRLGEAAGGPESPLDAALFDELSTISIDIPPLADRPEDLPLVAQKFLEDCNSGSDRQIGSIRRDALDQLALHSWPGELDELRSVITAAHAVCTSHHITPADLPPVIHHAAQAAARQPRHTERIVLDELLATIEKEAICRAMAATRGNKSEAAGLLGVTRPRLYRRLVQLGLVAEPAPGEVEAPEFIEEQPADSPDTVR
jgi:DNA-binding NtrC family response regulator